MSATLAEFNCLTDAEQYLQFFNLPYDAQFVNVNRLHILQKFSQSIKEIDAAFPELPETEKLAKYQEALKESCDLFLVSSPLEQKLFKVFQNKPQDVVLLTEIAGE